jgi:predicted dehydrogenase/threonine dehydrogenase-like Zn-dependent dehydrogenase
MLVDFGKAGLIEKARQQPEKVRMVLDKLRTDGLLPTLAAVRNKLDRPLALGYCNVGQVVEVGTGVAGFQPGDRVVCNGHHAEVVSVPENLCAKVPVGLGDDEAVFTVIGAIALEGVRLAEPTLGEAVVVMGLGLVGQLAVQLLRAQGCRLLATDFDRHKLNLAQRFGAEVVDLSVGADPVSAAALFSRGRGVDAVLITASTASSEPIHQAAQMCRKRGRIVLVGVTGLELSRADFYEKELTFQVSCSYGPGRYDLAYEEKGQDYPLGFVRWTAQRNMEAVLDLLADGRLDVKPLISHRFPIVETEKAYELLTSAEPSLGIVLEYPAEVPARGARTVVLNPTPVSGSAKAVVSFIGAGDYATGVLIPAFKTAGARLRCVASSGGVSAWHAGRKFGFEETTSDVDRALADPVTTVVVVATRHDTHARLVVEALRAGKHVFVEKPLCLTLDELAEIETVARTAGRHLVVGFNRRFAPHVDRMRSLLAGVPGPRAFVVTVNAGAVPRGHWTEDPEVGGGRVLGEACHFIDLLRYLAGAPVTRWARFDLDTPAGDTTNLELVFADGSIGTIHYFANGSRRFPKERVEVFAGGRVLELDNFRVLRGYGWPGFSRMRLWRQDKGQRACASAFVRTVEQGGPAPIPLEEILEVSRVTIELARAGAGCGEG